MKWYLLPLLAASANADMFRINFDVRRGNSKSELSDVEDSRPFLAKRDGSLDMVLQNQQTFYLASLQVGSEKNEIGVLVDTGSSDLWLMSHDLDCIQTRRKRDVIVNAKVAQDKNNKQAATPTVDDAPVVKNINNKAVSATTIIIGASGFPGGSGGGSFPSGNGGAGTNTCTSYGSFNTGESSSFNRNSSAEAFEILYADGTEALGIWGYDNVIIGDTTVSNLSFAVANQTSSDIGVLGIGLPGLEVTYSNSFGGNYQYENLPIKLRNQGTINKNLYSLYLGPPTATNGSILFGAVDHAKYSGQLQTVQIINTNKNLGYNEAIRIEIIVDNIVLNSTGQTVQVASNPIGAVLDTGSTLSYLPQALLDNLVTGLNGKYSSSAGTYIVECTNDPNVKVTINFSGVSIDVPLVDLLLPGSSSATQCYLGVLAQSSRSDYILFGDNVLRNAYVVYDLEDFEVSLAQVNFTDNEDIEVVTSAVPSAVQAEGFSSTTLASARLESSASGAVTYKAGTLSGARSGSATRTGSGSTSTGSSGSGSGSKSAASYLEVSKFLLLGLGSIVSFVVLM